HHQRQTRIQNSLAVERAKLSLPDAAYAKSILTADIKRDFLFKGATVLLKEPNHTAKMIVCPWLRTIASNADGSTPMIAMLLLSTWGGNRRSKGPFRPSPAAKVGG